MKPLPLTILFAALLSGAIACERSTPNTETSSSSSIELPGEGKTVQGIHVNVIEEQFQTAVVNELLEKLGYEIEEPEEVISAPLAFLAIAQRNVDFTAIAWDKVFAEFYENSGGDEKLEKVGVLVDNTIQGYQIDKKTAEEHNITHIDQLKDPEIAKLFDSDRNGKANFTGCPPGWGCELVIEHHLDAYGLRETVEHDQGMYGLLIADTITRYEQGEPILFYTWTPMWLAQVLKPGEDTIWLEVPYTDLPEEQGDISEKDSTVEGKNLGFAIDRIRIVANKEFLNANPAAKKLFELIEIPIEDINAQNLRVREGENSQEDIVRHAEEWIEENQETVSDWLAKAIKE
ncbi:MAG: glycine betaine/L-proline ABC transporter substrate-binding protein ProX [Cyanobacteria bacterium SBLK]|nr:glycine betaine/L-proline ABC transporter substrate-binding protein ProX [Cyanobacteria bacterium SBLK]